MGQLFRSNDVKIENEEIKETHNDSEEVVPEYEVIKEIFVWMINDILLDTEFQICGEELLEPDADGYEEVK